MGVIEGLKMAQFVVDANGQRTGVLLSVDAWDALLEWLEDMEDTAIAKRELAALKDAGGRPAKAGWLAWEDVKGEWDNVQDMDVADSSRGA